MWCARVEIEVDKWENYGIIRAGKGVVGWIFSVGKGKKQDIWKGDWIAVRTY